MQSNSYQTQLLLKPLILTLSRPADISKRSCILRGRGGGKLTLSYLTSSCHRQHIAYIIILANLASTE